MGARILIIRVASKGLRGAVVATAPRSPDAGSPLSRPVPALFLVHDDVVDGFTRGVCSGPGDRQRLAVR